MNPLIIASMATITHLKLRPFFTHLPVNNLHPRLLSTQSCQVVVTDSTHLASLMATIAIG